MKPANYMRTGIERASQASAMVRGMSETALQLLDGGQVSAAADRLQTAVDELRAYHKRLHGYVAPKREGGEA